MNKLFFKHENMSKKEYIKLGLVCIVVGGLIVAACIVLGGLILGTI